MDQRTSEQPHMVWVGPLPPHLARREAAAIEDPAEPPLEWDDEPPPSRLSMPPRLASAIGFAVALAAGVAIGSLIPRLLHHAPHVVATPSASTRMAKLVPAPAPAERPPLQVRVNPPPDDSPVASEAAAPARPPVEPSPHPRKPPPQRIVVASAGRPHTAASRDAQSGACRMGESRADYDVCAQPMLQSADQDLKRAYQQALSAGVSAQALQADQSAWTRERELAARRGPIDLVGAYSAQIARIEMMSEAPH
jgi:uncharacterized protein YecT (DUF1311 family)